MKKLYTYLSLLVMTLSFALQPLMTVTTVVAAGAEEEISTEVDEANDDESTEASAVSEAPNDAESAEVSGTSSEVPESDETTTTAVEEPESEDEPEPNSNSPPPALMRVALEDTGNLIADVAVTINGETVNNGDEIEVAPGTSLIGINYTITRPNDYVINADDTYTIDLPEIVKIGDTTKDLRLEDGTKLGTYTTSGGQLIITFNEVAENYDNFTVNVEFTGEVDATYFENNDEGNIYIPKADGTSFTLNLKPTPTGQAEGEDRKEAGEPYVLNEDGSQSPTSKNPTHVDWTVRANNSGETATNAKVIDNLGDNLTFVPGSVVVEKIIYNYKYEVIGSETVDPSEYDVNETDTGFEVVLGDIENAYDISYTTAISRPEGGGNLSINNAANIVSDMDSKTVSDEVAVEFSSDIPVITKDGALDEIYKDIVNWTVEYNYGQENLGQMTLTDTLSRGEIVDGSVVVRQVETDVDGNMTEDLGAITPEFDEEGNLVLDAEGKAYLIEFQSSVPVGLNEIITNTVSDNYEPNPNTDDATVGVNTIPKGGKVGEQLVDTAGNPYIEWTITMNSEKINVPSIDVRDVFNSEYLDFDTTDDSLYELYQDDQEVNNFSIVPYEHTDGRTGFYLNVSDAGSHTYKFVYRTYYTVAGMQQPNLANNAELVFLDGDGVGIGDSVDIDYIQTGPKAGINKSGRYISNENNTAQEIEWTITFNESRILLENPIITDEFTSGNYQYVDDSLVISSSDGQVLPYDEPTFDENGFELRFNGNTNAEYTIKYRTTVDNTNNLTHTNKATLTWQGGSEVAPAEVGVRHPEINKSGEVVVNDDGTKTVNWTVDFNTNAHIIKNFELLDTYSPASVTVSDIKITTSEKDVTDQFDISDPTDGKFTVSKDHLDAVPYQLTYSTTLSATEEKENISNKAYIKYTGGSDSADETIPNPKLQATKEATRLEKNADSEENPVISWQINVNTNSANKWVNMVNPILTDTIPSDQRLVKDSFVVKRINGSELSSDEYTITQEDNSFTIDLPDGPYQYEITYNTEILEYPSAHASDFDRYENFGTFTAKGYDAIPLYDYADYFNEEYPNNLLTKTGVQSPETENIEWALTLNPDGLTIEDYKIVDTLESGNHTYVEDSVVITNESGTDITNQYNIVTDNTVEKPTLSITPADGQTTLTEPLNITYDTRLNPGLIGSNIEVTNSASLYGGEQGNINEGGPVNEFASQWSYGGGGSGTTLSFTLDKNDPSGEPIPGAEFTFKRVLVNGNEEDPIGGVVTVGEDGTLEITGARAGRYKMTETYVPEGYDRYEGTIYMVIGYANPADETVTSDYTIQLTDEAWNPLTNEDSIATTNNNTGEGNAPILTIENDVIREDITAKKQWFGEGLHPESYLQLFRTVDGTNYEAVGEPRAVGNTPEKIVEVTWENVESYQSGTPALEYEYKVEEVDAEGNPFTPEGYVKEQTDALTVTNITTDIPTIEATKIITGRENIPLANDEFEFMLVDSEGNEYFVKNKAGGQVVFDDYITTDKLQEILDNTNQSAKLSYQLSEVNSDGNGITSDNNVFTFIVEVIYDAANKLFDINLGDNNFAFTNEYTAESTSVELKVNKAVDSEYLNDNNFTFQLKDSSGQVIDQKTIEGPGEVTFDAITYLDDKTSVSDNETTYTYTISEVDTDVDGVIYDTKDVAVEVTVKDNGHGEMEATVTYDGQPAATFNNSYQAEPVEVALEANKELTGQNLTAGQFSFTLTGEGVDQTKTNALDGTVAFEPITFNEVGTYNFTISENNTEQAGVTYAENIENVTVTVSDTGTGKLSAEVVYGNGQASFENSYRPNDTSITISGTKALTGQNLADDQFTFGLYEGENVVDTATSNSDGDFSFNVNYTVEDLGTHYYKVREVNTGQGGVTYDEKDYDVAVEITDVGQDGQLDATVRYLDGEDISFENTYAASDTTLNLQATKVADHEYLQDNEFTFNLYQVVGENEELLDTKTVEGSSTVNFKEITYTDEFLETSGDEQHYTYVIREENTGDGGVTYDSNPVSVNVTVTDNGQGELVKDITYEKAGDAANNATFTNTYQADPVTIDLAAQKELTGQVLEADQFTFELAGDASQTKTNDVNGAVDFDEITYTEAGVYEYTISETPATAGGMTYDPTVYNVTVTVTDNKEGQLLASVEYKNEDEVVEAAKFNNAYAATDVTLDLKANKVAEHEYLANNDFIFVLTGEGIEDTKTITGPVEVNFDTITYTDEDLTVSDNVQEYTYTITEENTSDGGVTYDAQPVTVNVVVKDNGAGAMVVDSVTYEKAGESVENATFTNTYQAAPVTIDLQAHKSLAGQSLDPDEFTFTLSGDDEQTVTNAADGTIDFEDITFTEVGTYTYQISEVAGTAGGMNYDPTVYDVTVVVTDDTEGQLLASIEYKNGDEAVEAAEFNNEYTAEPTTTTLQATKSVNSDFLDDDTFTFVLRDENGAELDRKAIDGAGTITFDEITLADTDSTTETNESTYTYAIVEVPGNAGGVTYDSRVYTVTVVAKDNGQGQMEHVSTTYSVNDEDVDEAVFENNYQAAPTSAQFAVSKDLTGGKDLEEGQFTFELTGAAEQTATNEADGAVTFAPITYTEAGVYEYTISEVVGNDNNINYDGLEVGVTVTVTDDGLGQLHAVVEYTDDTEFNNTYKKVSVGDYVWIDENRDGLQDETDVPLEGVVLEITDEEGNPVTDVHGNPVEPTTTDENGYYIFKDLPIDNTYVVTIDRETSKEALEGLGTAPENVGDDKEVDSSLWSETSDDMIEDGQHDPTLDFGFVRTLPVDITIEVNKELSGGKDLAAGQFTFQLLQGENVVDETTNAADGTITFAGIEFTQAGEFTYTVKEVAGEDNNFNYDAAEFEIVVEITDDGKGQLHANVIYPEDFEFNNSYKKVSVGDYVWLDENFDGLQDETDVPLKDVVLTITDAEGNPVTDVYGNLVEPTTTDANGYYIFKDLPIDNTYVVRVDEEAFAETYPSYTPTVETEENRENDSSTWVAISDEMVEDRQHDPTLDFGFVKEKVSVGDYVWIDENGDGLQDDTDKPLEGVVLEITDEDGNPVTDVYGNPVEPTVTDENGHYIFENLPADKVYVVTIDQDASKEALDGLMPTVETEGNRENDSSTWTATSEFLPNDGDHDPTLDFGFVREKVSVGDYVWIDENGDGLQDDTDKPLEGVVLEITDEDGNPVTDVYGNPVEPTVTDENGHYIFENLPADKVYVVTIDQDASKEALDGLMPTVETEGNRENDSSTWTATSEFLPNDGDHDPTLDFGFVRTDTPGTGEDPDGPETPGTDEDPDGPETPGTDEDPDGPETPGTGEETGGPETPGANEDSEGPDTPEEEEAEEFPETGQSSSIMLALAFLITGISVAFVGNKKIKQD